MKGESEVRLEEYEEIIGEFVELREENNEIEVILSAEREKKLKYASPSKEAEILKDEFDEIEAGTKVGLLKTDLTDKTVLVREVE